MLPQLPLSRRATWVLVVAFLWALVGPTLLLAQTTDVDVGTQFNALLAALAGFVGVFLTGIGKIALAKLEQLIGIADAALTKLYKPIQPIIAMGFGLLVPLIAKLVHGPLPDGTTIASAPIGVLVFIVLRELKQKFFPSVA